MMLSGDVECSSICYKLYVIFSPTNAYNDIHVNE